MTSLWHVHIEVASDISECPVHEVQLSESR